MNVTLANSEKNLHQCALQTPTMQPVSVTKVGYLSVVLENKLKIYTFLCLS